MRRVVQPESLDSLAADDPAAIGSRRDLRRIHRVMRTRAIVSRALGQLLPARTGGIVRVLEIGAGDGSLLLGVARSALPSLRRVELTLLDRQALVSDATITAYRAAGWTATPDIEDVFDWASRPPRSARRWDLVVANLFLHHFEPAPLSMLLSTIAARCDRFLACEPRRGRLALVGSHLVAALGANAVTREDAVLSVHAGFSGDELSSAWPVSDDGWQLGERPAGLFSHCFTARRQACA